MYSTHALLQKYLGRTPEYADGLMCKFSVSFFNIFRILFRHIKRQICCVQDKQFIVCYVMKLLHYTLDQFHVKVVSLCKETEV